MNKRSNGAWALLVLGLIGMAVLVCIPNEPPRRRYSPTKACIANLKQIQGAIEQWSLETKRSTNDPVSISDISGSPTDYIKQLINKELKCPTGGTYSVTTVGENPSCSFAGHTL